MRQLLWSLLCLIHVESHAGLTVCNRAGEDANVMVVDVPARRVVDGNVSGGWVEQSGQFLRIRDGECQELREGRLSSFTSYYYNVEFVSDSSWQARGPVPRRFCVEEDISFIDYRVRGPIPTNEIMPCYVRTFELIQGTQHRGVPRDVRVIIPPSPDAEKPHAVTPPPQLRQIELPRPTMPSQQGPGTTGQSKVFEPPINPASPRGVCMTQCGSSLDRCIPSCPGWMMNGRVDPDRKELFFPCQKNCYDVLNSCRRTCDGMAR